ncbi:hypothetical protein PR202_gb27421 [Eleusine coracana subsp. coracana]|uniref:Uncharacterized protein n=1 Tax=Eleusine coracana subsp. coracana TaxID=191504 RepID=A0AAV5FUZ0_ELECO|nr:hypothetical protein PR202_gb27421 [Eleusine coracana subsp. coracana]
MMMHHAPAIHNALQEFFDEEPLIGEEFYCLIGRNKDARTDPDEFVFRSDSLPAAKGSGLWVSGHPGSKEKIKMMPFGAGRRYCPGAGQGVLHVKMFLAVLVHEFEWTHDGCGVDLTLTISISRIY